MNDCPISHPIASINPAHGRKYCLSTIDSTDTIVCPTIGIYLLGDAPLLWFQFVGTLAISPTSHE
ncbi:hypothetical protein [Coleofasciculus sp.]|uniref:hypothetical protein n=1 Tax=Coleofasciculus sp. TaxID=3100458 RepID=UPI003A44AD82